jgi:hypothetical protein
MTLPYETATSGDKALAELQRTLGKFGCQSFGTMIDAEKGCTMVQFKWRGRTVSLEASWKGYAVAWQRAHPWAKVRGNDRGDAAHDEPVCIPRHPAGRHACAKMTRAPGTSMGTINKADRAAGPLQ